MNGNSNISLTEFPEITICDRKIGRKHLPLVIPDIGINAGNNVKLAKKMIDAAAKAYAECVKFQCHIPEAEMLKEEAQKIIPINAKESIYDIMEKCSFTEEQERELKEYTESKGMFYLSTPFSREAVDRLERLGVVAYKIGSGECNNYPLVEYIASKGKPVILSTGMNNLELIKESVNILRKNNVPFALLHCTSLYPTPHDKVRLHAMKQLEFTFGCVVGLSDHTVNNFSCLGAVALNASILERHFTHSKKIEGPDIFISMDSKELQELVLGSIAVFESLQGSKSILPEEKKTIDFAYSSVVSIKNIKKGEKLTVDNIWCKRPGIGEIRAGYYNKILGKSVSKNISKNTLLKWSDVLK